MALITLMDKPTNAIKNEESVISIFFSKAFDTVNHDNYARKVGTLWNTGLHFIVLHELSLKSTTVFYLFLLY